MQQPPLWRCFSHHWASDQDINQRKEGDKEKSHSRLLRNLLTKWQRLIKNEITWCSNTRRSGPWRGTRTWWTTYNRASSSYLYMNKGNTEHIFSLCTQYVLDTLSAATSRVTPPFSFFSESKVISTQRIIHQIIQMSVKPILRHCRWMVYKYRSVQL